jgi:hypothetical protein
MIYAQPKPEKKSRTRERMRRRLAPTSNFTKPQGFRWAEYLSFVRRHPCVVTGTFPVECAHFGEHGIGTRASDLCTLPLSPEMHRIQGTMRIEEFGELMHFNPYRCAFELLREFIETKFRNAEEESA